MTEQTLNALITLGKVKYLTLYKLTVYDRLCFKPGVSMSNYVGFTIQVLFCIHHLYMYVCACVQKKEQ